MQVGTFYFMPAAVFRYDPAYPAAIETAIQAVGPGLSRDRTETGFTGCFRSGPFSAFHEFPAI